MVHYFCRYPHFYTYFDLQGCVSSLFLELDFSYQCGTFAVRFLVKNRTVWTTHLAYLEQLVQRFFFIGDFEPCGPHVAIPCGTALYIVVSFGLTCGTGLQHHHQHSSTLRASLFYLLIYHYWGFYTIYHDITLLLFGYLMTQCYITRKGCFGSRWPPS